MTDGTLPNDPARAANVTDLAGFRQAACGAPLAQPRFRETVGDYPVMTLCASLEAPIAEARTMGAAAMLTAPGLRDVLAKRIRQIEHHGFTLEHDLGHTAGALALGAVSYLNVAVDQLCGKDIDLTAPDADTWPWEREAWRPGDARENLIDAICIALATIDRIDAAPQDATAEAPRLDAGRHDRGWPLGVA